MIRAAARRLACGLSLVALGLVFVLGTGLAVVLPAAAARAQARIEGCQMTDTELDANLVGGTQGFAFSTPNIHCAGPYTGGTPPAVVMVCEAIVGSGVGRSLKKDGNPAGPTIPYQLEPASGSPGSGQPIPDENPHYWGFPMDAGPPPFDLRYGVGVVARYTVPDAPAPGVYTDTITGRYFIIPYNPVSPCTRITDSLTPNATFTVVFTATVSPNCFIASTTDLNFVVQTDGAKTVDTRAMGGVSVTCPPNQPYTIYLDAGQNSKDPFNRVLVPVSGGAGGSLTYQLLKPGGGDVAWTDVGGPGPNGGGGVSATGDGAAQPYAIEGVIRPNQALPRAGDYADRVTITVVY